ncbi:MAG TPA: exodeoxyribonuclease V subunit gamma [Rhabdochlamydiaceae bacterium]
MRTENTEVFLSNRLETLADLLKNRLFFSGLKAFEKRVVIVPCESTKSFLIHRFAQDPQLEIAAGMHIVTLDQALDPYLKGVPSFLQLSLALNDLLAHLEDNTLFASLRAYLNPLSRIEGFSEELAQIFLRYGLYGGKFLKEWEGQAGWQQELWKRIFPDRFSYPYKAAPAEPLQETFYLFGHSFFPRLYWQLFKNSIHFQLSPCQLFWGDVTSDKESARLLRKAAKGQDELAAYLQDKNRLLANMGKLGRASFAYFDEDSCQLEEHYQEGEVNTALEMLQNNVLNLCESPLTSDASLQLHAAPSKQREVEALLETLYELGAHPKDVIVYAPDIADYVPYIQNVFDGRLDYAVFDLPLSSKNIFVQGFFHLLSLPHSRFDTVSILKLFSFAPFLEKFGITEEEVRDLHAWVEQEMILWGVDEEQRNAFLTEGKMLEGSPRGTWAHAFDAGLWALAFRSNPFLSPELFGELIHLVKSLKEDFQDVLDHKVQSVAVWMGWLKNLAQKYFSLSSDDVLLLEAFAQLSMDEVTVGFKSIERAVKSLLSRKNGAIRASHLEGVRFFSLKSGKALPAQVICLLGMEEESYPRKEVRSSLSEMTTDADYCPTSYDEDRYILLELLLAARSHLIVSYQRISSGDGKAQGPSLCVGELFGKEYPEIIHPQLSFDRVHFEKPSFEPLAHFLAAKAYYGPKHATPFFVPEFHQKAPLKKTDRAQDILIDLKAMQQLVRHPIQFYLQKTLRIYFTREGQHDLEFSYSLLKKNLPLGAFKDVALQRLQEEQRDLDESLACFGVKREEIASTFVDLTVSLDEGRTARIQGTLDGITPEGFIYSGNLLRAWPSFLVYLCLLQGKPQLLLTKTQNIKQAPAADPRLLLKEWIAYYELSLENVSPLMPDWADALLSENRERLEKAMASSVSSFASYQDEILSWLNLREEKMPAAEALIANWREPLHAAFSSFQTWRGDDKL